VTIISASMLKSRLKSITAQNLDLKKKIKLLAQQPFNYGLVININPDKTVAICTEGKTIEAKQPAFDLCSGMTVKLLPETNQIFGVADWLPAGEICIVKNIIDAKVSEIDYQDTSRIVYNGQSKPEVGDRIVVDTSVSVIIRNLGKDNNKFALTEATNLTWDDIGGLDEAKRQMIEAVEWPEKYKNLYLHYGKEPIGGVLLYGPPGCGKTLIAKAAATALAAIHGEEVSSGFFYVKGPEMLDRYVGVTEALIRSLFQKAREHKKKHGYPAVIFFDEAEALLCRRGSGVSSDMEKTVVPTFLAETDGLDDSSCLLILATNRPDMLDPAVVRDGRIDRKIKIGRPTPETAGEIFKLHLKNVPLGKGAKVSLARRATKELFSEDYSLYQIIVATRQGKERVLNLTLGHICNGSMIRSIVDQASSEALHRDIDSGVPTGITVNDIRNATYQTYMQNMHLDHKESLGDFVHDFKDDVIKIKKTQNT